MRRKEDKEKEKERERERDGGRDENREQRMPFLLTKKGTRRGRKASGDEVSTTALEPVAG